MATINRNVRQFTDLNLLFTKHPVTADVTKVSNENAVKAAIKNLIQTKNYERPFHPEIGCQVYSMLFENFTPITKTIMEKSIQDVLDKFEPRARLTDVSVEENIEENAVNVTVQFTLNNLQRPITVTTTLVRAR